MMQPLVAAAQGRKAPFGPVRNRFLSPELATGTSCFPEVLPRMEQTVGNKSPARSDWATQESAEIRLAQTTPLRRARRGT